MSDQGELFDGRPDLDAIFASEEEPYPRPSDRRRAIVDRFWEFHEANPHVFDALREVCLEVVRAGVAHWSIVGAYEVVRFSNIRTTGVDSLKLNDNFRALYSRLLMYRVPELEGFFSVRRRRRR